jgi:hypothetical protein
MNANGSGMSAFEPMVPDELEADATVPQCLDNQYVSNAVFQEMIGQGPEGRGYEDPEVASHRKRQALTEFRRSLVYSTQVVINRAFFTNSPFLYDNYLPSDKQGLESFAKLLKGEEDSPQAIVPYLHTGKYLGERLPFEEDLRGKEALKALLDEVGGHVVPVWLDPDPDENAKETLGLEMKFGEYLSGHVKKLTDEGNEILFNDMAAEIFGTRHAFLQEPGAWDSFRKQVAGVADYAHGKTKVSRTDVYKRFLIQGRSDSELADNVIKGKFRVTSGYEEDYKDAFVLEIKKLVDLVYNTNLPDRLGRYTFTPVDMPSRNALRDFQRVGGRRVDRRLVQESGALRDDLNRIFMANAQRAMALPLLSDLSITDIVEVRRLDAWRSFSLAQQAILQDPLRILDNIENFTQRFNAFQTELSRWYFKKYKLKKKAERYANFATVALQIGGSILVALGFPGKDAASVITEKTTSALIPLVVKRPVLKLMVYVVDLVNQAVDSDRSYSIDLMQVRNDYTREEVKDLFAKFNATNSEYLVDDTLATQLSDQGKR